MGNVCKAIYGVSGARALAAGLPGMILALALLPGGGATWMRGADMPVKNASDFSSVEYYDPPNQMQIKSRLAGAQAVPQADGRVLIQQLKLEIFETNGRPKYVVEAPECLYDQIKGTANSAGRMEVRQADGQFRLTGVGFEWRQEDEFLILTNQVETDILTGTNLTIIP